MWEYPDSYMPRPLMPSGDRRVTVTLTLAPPTLDFLDHLVVRSGLSRGRVIDSIFQSIVIAKAEGVKVRDVYLAVELLNK